ncbi:MAG: hypothetical protein H8E55_19770 [Pelagibacterales bacterium]|nr:hypothetical protein [Pelagibacterales bacterium]
MPNKNTVNKTIRKVLSSLSRVQRLAGLRDDAKTVTKRKPRDSFIRSRLYIERPKRTRTCHWCHQSIKPTEVHHAIYRKSSWSFWGERENICVFCLEDHVRELKRGLKVPIKQRRKERELERIIEEI